MANELLSELSNDMGKLLDQEYDYDVIIKAGEGNDSREFKVHSLILRARCTYFRSALSNNWAHRESGIINFNKPNISPKIFEILLKYLYTAEIELSKHEITILLQILIAADELNLQKLIFHVEQYLLENQYDYIRKDPIKILKITFRHEVCSILRDYCFEVICEDPNLLFKSKEFLTLDKSLLLSLIKRDVINLEEIDLWNNLIKWSLSQINNNNNNKDEKFSNWNEDNINNLRDLIQDFIPLIRWFQITSSEFRKYILPYKKIIPKDLFHEILCYNLDTSYEVKTIILPPRISQKSGKLDSLLIEQKHAAIISSWIDKQEINFYDRKRLPYSFKLLYRASRDGFSAKKFHKLCDNKGSTVTITKVRSNGKLIGGYNPLDWKPHSELSYLSGDSCWYSTFDSFLFSFPLKPSSNDNFTPKIARIGNGGNISDYAIGYNINYGPSFGGGWDFSIQDNNLIYSYGPYSYPDCGNFIAKNQQLKIDDYEVFQIIKK
ncbi:BTB-domain-containing protein [Rhizophagus irregularis]|uniref:BTB-domain-containing protein n=1 Tax=Rhizophagus irregularis TaxID=588596 RepID=A0A2N0SBZ5_9GLOM|nr:BTB-domain-containing protein [Rhizophagus irregularis]